jgi:hypothetical protein
MAEPQEVLNEFEAELEREAESWLAATEDEYARHVGETKDSTGHEHDAKGLFTGGGHEQHVEKLKGLKAEADKHKSVKDAQHLADKAAEHLQDVPKEHLADIQKGMGIRKPEKSRSGAIAAIQRKILEAPRAHESIEY